MLDELFIQHPLPWTFSDNREGHEGEVNVYDDSGGIVVCMGDMEDCTYADILLAHAIAALPELLACCAERFANSPCPSFADELDVIAAVADAGLGRSNTAAGLRERATRIRAALDKAGVNHV